MAAGREPKQSLELFNTCQGLLLPVGSVTINIIHILYQEKSDAIKNPMGWLSPLEMCCAILQPGLPCLLTLKSVEQIWGLEMPVHSSGQNPMLGVLSWNAKHEHLKFCSSNIVGFWGSSPLNTKCFLGLRQCPYPGLSLLLFPSVLWVLGHCSDQTGLQ